MVGTVSFVEQAAPSRENASTIRPLSICHPSVLVN